MLVARSRLRAARLLSVLRVAGGSNFDLLAQDACIGRVTAEGAAPILRVHKAGIAIHLNSPSRQLQRLLDVTGILPLFPVTQASCIPQIILVQIHLFARPLIDPAVADPVGGAALQLVEVDRVAVGGRVQTDVQADLL